MEEVNNILVSVIQFVPVTVPVCSLPIIHSLAPLRDT
jgi:hypothetical protein